MQIDPQNKQRRKPPQPARSRFRRCQHDEKRREADEGEHRWAHRAGQRHDGEDDERGAQPLPMNPLAQRDTYEKQRTDRESGLENDETKRTSSSIREAHPHLREPLVIDPRLVRRERIAVHGGNPAGIDDVLAEPHVPPQVSVGRGLDDDDQKRSEPGSANESPGGQLTTRMHGRNLRADSFHRTTAKNVCPNQDRVASATGWGPEVLADARRHWLGWEGEKSG